jgi:predicted dienelactone hydrolase
MAKRLIARFAALFLACSFSVCRAQQPQHIIISGRDVAVWKPSAAAPASGYPLIVFSHGFTGCNTQTKFLMEALAEAGYLVLAPNHKDAGCGGGRYIFGNGMRKPEVPFRQARKWSGQTYRDRREDMEAVLDAALSHSEFDGVRVDAGRVGGAGHSLGGYTALGLAGGWPSWKDPRIKAVLALSPYSSPYLSKEQLGNLNIPVMYQGGTRDSGITPTVKKSGGAYDQSVKPKYYIELDGAGHLAWTNLNRMHVSSIDAYSVAFFDAYLKGRKGDLAKLLNGGRPKDVSDLRSAE